MKLDTSVAPEIAMLAEALGVAAVRPADRASGPAGPDEAAEPGRAAGLGGPTRTAPASIGYLAGCLRRLVADPQRWWDLVRFDPQRAVRAAVAVPEPGCEAWLIVLPPGHRGEEQEQGGEVACLVAGESTELTIAPSGLKARPLQPGRVRVRGGQRPYQVINAGSGYAISLHARSLPGRPPA
jgi:hypothetical protein